MKIGLQIPRFTWPGGDAAIAPNPMFPADINEQCRALAELGVSHAIFNMPNVHEITTL